MCCLFVFIQWSCSCDLRYIFSTSVHCPTTTCHRNWSYSHPRAFSFPLQVKLMYKESARCSLFQSPGEPTRSFHHENEPILTGGIHREHHTATYCCGSSTYICDPTFLHWSVYHWLAHHRTRLAWNLQKEKKKVDNTSSRTETLSSLFCTKCLSRCPVCLTAKMYSWKKTNNKAKRARKEKAKEYLI